MTEIHITRPIGEIVEVSSIAFTAQCLEVPRAPMPRFYDPPDFGAFVKIAEPPTEATPPVGPSAAARSEIAGEPDEEEDPFAARPPAVARPPAALSPNVIYAVVSFARTVSVEPSRRPTALGYASEEELLARYPQVFELLATEFFGLLLAYTDSAGALCVRLPLRPPKVHSRVALCDADEVRAITDDLSFLQGLLSQAPSALAAVPQESLAAAALRGAWTARDQDEAYLLGAGKRLLQLLGDDYDRLQAVMRSVL